MADAIQTRPTGAGVQVDPLRDDFRISIEPIAGTDEVEAAIETLDGRFRYSRRWPKRVARAFLYAIWQQLQASPGV